MTFTTADGKVTKICQVLSTEAFTLLCHVFLLSMKVYSPFFVVLPTRLSVPVEVNVPLVELTHVWTRRVRSDRSLGRPKEWNGEPSCFDDFAFKFSNWLSGLPGDAERFLEESVTMTQPIQWATLTPREKVVARRVATALRALISGKALSCIRHHLEKTERFRDVEIAVQGVQT